MKKMLVLGLAVVSLGGLRAQETPPAPAPDAAPKPLPPIEESARPDRGPRPWMKHRGEKPEGRPGMDRKFMKREHGDFRGGPKAKGGPKGEHGGILASELKLTPEQKEKAKAIMEAAKPKIQAIQEEGREKVKAVMKDAINELRPILTPEQVAVLDGLQKLRADKEALDAAQKKVAADQPEDAAKPKKKKAKKDE